MKTKVVGLLDARKALDRSGNSYAETDPVPPSDWIIKKREEESGLPALDSEAYGTVVEIGPGSGNQLSRYDKSKIRKVYGIEPNKDLHEALRKTIKAEDLEGIYEIVPYGVEDFERLKEYGISEGSVDTVMSISVLCSVPRPQEMTKAMYKLLKPGGQMLVHEHIASVDPVSGFVQGERNRAVAETLQTVMLMICH